MVVRKSAVICQRVGASARAVVDTIAGRVLAAARCLAFDIINLILIVELEIGMLELPRVIAVEGRRYRPSWRGSCGNRTDSADAQNWQNWSA